MSGRSRGTGPSPKRKVQLSTKSMPRLKDSRPAAHCRAFLFHKARNSPGISGTDASAPQRATGRFQHLLADQAESHRHVGCGSPRRRRSRYPYQRSGHAGRNACPGHQTGDGKEQFQPVIMEGMKIMSLLEINDLVFRRAIRQSSTGCPWPSRLGEVHALLRHKRDRQEHARLSHHGLRGPSADIRRDSVSTARLINDLKIHERAELGITMAWQEPVEVRGHIGQRLSGPQE